MFAMYTQEQNRTRLDSTRLGETNRESGKKLKVSYLIYPAKYVTIFKRGTKINPRAEDQQLFVGQRLPVVWKGHLPVASS